MTEAEEQAYTNGRNMALVGVMQQCIASLGYENATESAWIMERAQAVSMLRGLCAEFGDNDWPDDLHLADVIDRHLGDYLRR